MTSSKPLLRNFGSGKKIKNKDEFVQDSECEIKMDFVSKADDNNGNFVNIFNRDSSGETG